MYVLSYQWPLWLLLYNAQIWAGTTKIQRVLYHKLHKYIWIVLLKRAWWSVTNGADANSRIAAAIATKAIVLCLVEIILTFHYVPLC